MQRSNVVTGTQLKMLFLAGGNWLQVHASQLNNLNVFPVPDGDTGTNMSFTMQAAASHLKQMTLNSTDHAGQVAHLMAQGALLGSRGNSGTILSQIWHGFAEVVLDEPVITIPMFARGLQQAATCAYEAVFTPVEGTILTIINQMAATGERLAHSVHQYPPFLVAIVEEAQEALASTPNLLPQLRQAGVVDAGGLGLVYIVEGMVRHLQAKSVSSLDHPLVTVNHQTRSYQSAIQFQTNVQPYFDVQFLVRGQNLHLAEIRNQISQMGESPLVVGAKTLVKVHVHVNDPTIPLKYGLTQGDVTDIVVENISEQVEDYKQQKNDPLNQKFAVISMADGVGFTSLCSQLGADIVLNRQATTSIGVEQLNNTIQVLDANQVIVLPNNKQAEAVAIQSANIQTKPVVVLPTSSMPAVINALLTLNKALNLDHNVDRMTTAIKQVNTLEIILSTHFQDRQVEVYLDGGLIQTGIDIDQTCLQALATLDMSQFEVVTLYFGCGLQKAMAQQLTNKIHDAFPFLDIQILDGGQVHSIYIISLE